jgi:phenylacetic acid degradation operon negative regulatory protein
VNRRAGGGVLSLAVEGLPVEPRSSDGLSLLTETEAEMLPRLQRGYPAQHLLLTFIGDFGLTDTRSPIPSAVLVALLGDLGITPAGARAAVGRLSQRGMLERSKVGRNTAYAVTDLCAGLVRQARLVTNTFTGSLDDWDGRWTLIGFSISEDQRSQRTLLRTKLRWLGCAPLQDGLWISARPPGPELDAVLAEVGGSCVVFRADAVEREGRLDPLEAWPIEEVRAAYEEFVAEFGWAGRALAEGGLDAADALAVRLRSVYRWFNLANEKAELPARLLPPDWPAFAARSLFEELHDALGRLALERVVTVFGDEAPDLVGWVRARPLDEP